MDDDLDCYLFRRLTNDDTEKKSKSLENKRYREPKVLAAEEGRYFLDLNTGILVFVSPNNGSGSGGTLSRMTVRFGRQFDCGLSERPLARDSVLKWLENFFGSFFLRPTLFCMIGINGSMETTMALMNSYFLWCLSDQSPPL